MKRQMRFRTKQALTLWQMGYVPCSRHRTLQRNWGDDTPVWVADASSQETSCSWYGVLPRGFSIRHEKSQEMHVNIVFWIYKKVNCINFNLKKKKSCTKLGEGGLRVCSHNRFFHGISAHSIGFVPRLLQFWTWLPDTFVPVSEMQSHFFTQCGFQLWKNARCGLQCELWHIFLHLYLLKANQSLQQVHAWTWPKGHYPEEQLGGLLLKPNT